MATRKKPTKRKPTQALPTKPASTKAKARPRRKTPTAKARAATAAALAAQGASTPEIAATLGISRSQAWRVLTSEDCQQIVIEITNGHRSLLFSLVGEALGVIQSAFCAKTPDLLTKEGAVIPGGPDHYARLSAVSKLLQVLTAGRSKARPAEVENDPDTLADLLAGGPVVPSTGSPVSGNAQPTR